jgi:hypothetical protein
VTRRDLVGSIGRTSVYIETGDNGMGVVVDRKILVDGRFDPAEAPVVAALLTAAAAIMKAEDEMVAARKAGVTA